MSPRKPLHDEPMVGVHWTVRPDQKTWVAEQADALDQSGSQYVRDLIDQDMRRRDVREEE